MRRLLTICLLALAAALVAAPAATAAGATPTIKRVTPMRVSVGNLLTIRGSHFKAQRTRNTVIFRNSAGRTAFAKPRRAATSKLVVRVPAAVSRLLRVVGSRQRPTRLKLRVLAGKFSKFTTRRLSPVVTGVGDGDGGGGGGGGGGGLVVCDSSADHDGDLLANTLELSLGTDPCIADTDNDQMSDGWEYWSAKDLNVKAVPYPGKRPFPNALDPSDGGPVGAKFSNVDFDGDSLTTLEEYRAWRYTGSDLSLARLGVGLESALGYSDGTKFSRASDVPPAPAWRSSAYGQPNPAQPFPATYDFKLLYPSDAAVYRDDERDADVDGLSNWLEAKRGPGYVEYWPGYWKVDIRSIEPWRKAEYCGVRPGEFTERPFAELDLADPDVDGDTLLDGEDDQDNDDVNNITELYEVVTDLDNNGVGGVNPAWCGKVEGAIPTIDRGGVDMAVNPFNPCAPDPASRTCPPYIPFD
ncbi:MAG TPA: IPT/TIG domain-containing protein [Thermoleophilaceae bacterium]|nr:IPT/TIG domain-containing protein [Thermoleophilaceae bacterium]